MLPRPLRRLGHDPTDAGCLAALQPCTSFLSQRLRLKREHCRRRPDINLAACSNVETQTQFFNSNPNQPTRPEVCAGCTLVWRSP